MAEKSAIEWTDATVNFWWGCTKVGPGCDHCYAETLNNFRGNKQWGQGAPRRKIKGALKLLDSLNRRPWKEDLGRRYRVFMSSMCDVFDNEVDDEWRHEALVSAEHATNLDIQMLTKRISNVEKMVPSHWRNDWPRHIGLMITIVNQEEAERDIPRLLLLKAAYRIPWVGLSCEPLIAPLELRAWLSPPRSFRRPIDWVIAGGESGKDARPVKPGWIRVINHDCIAADVPFFFKQWGEWTPGENVDRRSTLRCAEWWNDEWHYSTQSQNQADDGHVDDQPDVYRVGKKAAGRMLDGRTHDDFPRAIA